jgi:hypothetical protein
MKVTESNEGLAAVEGIIVTIEAVFSGDEKAKVRYGYNIYNDENDDTIGFIELTENDMWKCDGDTSTLFDPDDFEGVLNYCVYLYLKAK